MTASEWATSRSASTSAASRLRTRRPATATRWQACGASRSRGRRAGRPVRLTTNEWYKAQQLGDTYWLYVVWDPLENPEAVPVMVRNPARHLDYAKKRSSRPATTTFRQARSSRRRTTSGRASGDRRAHLSEGLSHMRITRLEIENFRSIRQLVVDLGDTTVFVGPNNAGKTAILDALRIALTRRWGQRGTGFSEYDIHLAGDTADPKASSGVSIELRSEESEPGEWPDTIAADLGDIVQLDPLTARRAVA